MSMELEQVLPGEIERRSFEIITEELKGRRFDVGQEDIIKRVIQCKDSASRMQSRKPALPGHRPSKPGFRFGKDSKKRTKQYERCAHPEGHAHRSFRQRG